IPILKPLRTQGDQPGSGLWVSGVEVGARRVETDRRGQSGPGAGFKYGLIVSLSIAIGRGRVRLGCAAAAGDGERRRAAPKEARLTIDARDRPTRRDGR